MVLNEPKNLQKNNCHSWQANNDNFYESNLCHNSPVNISWISIGVWNIHYQFIWKCYLSIVGPFTWNSKDNWMALEWIVILSNLSGLHNQMKMKIQIPMKYKIISFIGYLIFINIFHPPLHISWKNMREINVHRMK